MRKKQQHCRSWLNASHIRRATKPWRCAVCNANDGRGQDRSGRTERTGRSRQWTIAWVDWDRRYCNGCAYRQCADMQAWRMGGETATRYNNTTGAPKIQTLAATAPSSQPLPHTVSEKYPHDTYTDRKKTDDTHKKRQFGAINQLTPDQR
ncbi:hypothetical protein BC831DRAFT_231823 [Entophlyctis helioformis]|nr:hypothetical protein BC831DRAFT_231823 [Entophlyctis helioformis]